MSDVALRKKRTVDVQRAFRQRHLLSKKQVRSSDSQLSKDPFFLIGSCRVNTVTSLESTISQLQDSCRDARMEANELRQENARLRLEFREREIFWRNLTRAEMDKPLLPAPSFTATSLRRPSLWVSPTSSLIPNPSLPALSSYPDLNSSMFQSPFHHSASSSSMQTHPSPTASISRSTVNSVSGDQVNIGPGQIVFYSPQYLFG